MLFQYFFLRNSKDSCLCLRKLLNENLWLHFDRVLHFIFDPIGNEWIESFRKKFFVKIINISFSYRIYSNAIYAMSGKFGKVHKILISILSLNKTTLMNHRNDISLNVDIFWQEKHAINDKFSWENFLCIITIISIDNYRREWRSQE